MSKGGLEPPRPNGHKHLKLARLPIPPLRLDRIVYRYEREILAEWQLGESSSPVSLMNISNIYATVEVEFNFF